MEKVLGKLLGIDPIFFINVDFVVSKRATDASHTAACAALFLLYFMIIYAFGEISPKH